MATDTSGRQWMRELARVRAQAAKLRGSRADRDNEALALVEDALQLLDLLRIECADLQKRCNELEHRLDARTDAARRLFDTLPQPIVTTDPAGIIVDANRAACALLARSRPKLTSHLLLHFVEDREEFSRIIRELPGSTGPVSAPARVRPTDRAPIDVTITALRDPRVDPPAWLWVMQHAS